MFVSFPLHEGYVMNTVDTVYHELMNNVTSGRIAPQSNKKEGTTMSMPHSPQPITENTLFFGDNLYILPQYFPTESVDLIYLDPPFNSNRNYNVLFKDELGEESEAQIMAFEDAWHWNADVQQAYEILRETGPRPVSDMIGALRGYIGTNQMMAYLVMMAARLVELHRVLKPRGSIYLHCDPSASHYLKIVMDTIFGAQNFRNEIIWKRTSSHNDSKRYASIHDTLLYYAKSSNVIWNPQYVGHDEHYVATHYNRRDESGRKYRLDNIIRSASMGPRPNLRYEYKGFTPEWGWRVVREKLEALDIAGRIAWAKSGTPYLIRYLDEMQGTAMPSVWDDIPPINSQAAERLGYATQKPLALLERIIQASSNPGDVVLDPFCGCGTAIEAAQHLKRRWIGIDITWHAIAIEKNRLLGVFGDIPYDVIGQPVDLYTARKMWQDDPFEFQWWAVYHVGGRPYDEQGGTRRGKKGSDRGIDGIIPFVEDASKDKLNKAIVQVKGGKPSARDVRDLVGTVDREKAAIGIFITLENPTRDMITEAASAGTYTPPVHYGGAIGTGETLRPSERGYPRIQIVTVKSLLHGERIKVPPIRSVFKQPQRVREFVGEQSRLELDADIG